MENNADNPTPEDTSRDIDSRGKGFQINALDKTVIAIPLLRQMEAVERQRRTGQRKAQQATKAGKEPPKPKNEKPFDVIIDLNLRFRGGRAEAIIKIKGLIETALVKFPNRLESGVDEAKSQLSEQYVFAQLYGDVIREIVRLDTTTTDDSTLRAIHRIWPDFEINAFINKSISTIKADAAHSAFSALGRDITWAVMDSGIDRTHRHFTAYANIDPDSPYHVDFTVPSTDPSNNPFRDDFGHGTHVAGIIAGQATDETTPIIIVTRQRDETGATLFKQDDLATISGTKPAVIAGMAPRCKLVSVKVLDGQGKGQASNLIIAIAKIQELNGYGRDIKIHGVNMSLGYSFEPEWFACGQSPLCIEVNRLVKSGVVVVVAAGNTGYGVSQSAFRGNVAAGVPLSINDPGNAELAITVGSTHRDMPHTYGVSFFSSKGPTGDGRLKPDLLAPGEKIISCAAGKQKAAGGANQAFDYIEDSGTSMAAPHVSGVIAAFLSIRREYIGQPEVVKDIFLSSATDLKRDRYFQGHGLIDLMRAIQSV